MHYLWIVQTMSIETPYLFTLAELSNIGNTRFVWPFHDLNVILFLFPCTKEKLTVCFKNEYVIVILVANVLLLWLDSDLKMWQQKSYYFYITIYKVKLPLNQSLATSVI